MPSTSAASTWQRSWVNFFASIKLLKFREELNYLSNLVMVEPQVFEAAGEARGDAGQAIMLEI